jgi:hypothetical protein
LVRLAEALADGRLEATQYAEAEAILWRAVTYADVEAVVGGLDAKASLAKRTGVVEQLDAAAAAGLLDVTEHHARVGAARTAATNEQLAALVSDLTTAPIPDSSSRPGLQLSGARRVTDDERKATDALLRAALDDGRLDLAEFDQRVRAAYAAKVQADLERLVADLSEPDVTPTGVSPVRRLLTAPPWLVLGGTVAAAGVAIWLAASGRPVLAVVLLAPWLLWQSARLLRTRPPAAPVAPATTQIVAAQESAGRLQPGGQPPAARQPHGGQPPAARQPHGGQPPAARQPHGGQPPAARQPRPPKRRRGALTLRGHSRTVTSVACLVLPDGTPVAISGSEDNTARVWNLDDGSLRCVLKEHTSDVVSVGTLTLPDETPVAVTVGKDRAARVWDLRDGSSRGTLPVARHDLFSVACLTLPNGKPVAIVGSSHAAHLCDLHDGTLVRQIGTKDKYVTRAAAVTAPDGRALTVLAEFNEVTVYDLSTGARLARFTQHTESIGDIACWILPDGTPVAVTASYDNTAQVWKLNTRSRMHTFTGHIDPLHAVACVGLPDGTPLAVTGGITAKAQMWDLRDGSVRKQLSTSAYALAGLTLPDRAVVVIAQAEVLHVHELQ